MFYERKETDFGLLQLHSMTMLCALARAADGLEWSIKSFISCLVQKDAFRFLNFQKKETKEETWTSGSDTCSIQLHVARLCTFVS